MKRGDSEERKRERAKNDKKGGKADRRRGWKEAGGRGRGDEGGNEKKK